MIYWYRWGSGSTSATTALKSKLSTRSLEEGRKGGIKKSLLALSSSPRPVCMETSRSKCMHPFRCVRNVWKDGSDRLAMWAIGRMPDSPPPPPPLAGHYSLGNVRLWTHGGQRLVYLLNNHGSWVASSAMRRGGLTVCPCSPSCCLLYYLCQPARFPSNTSSPHTQKHTDAICVLICELTYTYANTRAPGTHTPAHFHPKELAVPHVHDIHPAPESNFHVRESEFTVKMHLNILVREAPITIQLMSDCTGFTTPLSLSSL